MKVPNWSRDLIVVPIIIAILAATAWSVHKSVVRTAPQTQSVAITTGPTDHFFERLYSERLKEEGNRTDRVEQLLKEGRLSNQKARYTKGAQNLPLSTPPYKRVFPKWSSH
jgi:Tfp pilus assembly protein PilE